MPNHVQVAPLALLLLSTTAVADNVITVITAEDLLAACTTPDMHWVDFCNGYFQAAHDHAAIAGRACTPVGITRTLLAELHELHAPALLAVQPDTAEVPTLVLATKVLAGAYPCS